MCFNLQKPAHLDWFGWCTWDAFYKDVNPHGIREGLERYTKIDNDFITSDFWFCGLFIVTTNISNNYASVSAFLKEVALLSF